MVDLSKLSADLRGRIEKIMDGDGQNKDKVDSRAEYNELSALLAGKGKVSGDEKTFVEGMIVDYQEEYMVRDEVKQRVRDLIKNGEANKADDNAEINDLKDYKKTKGLTKEEKNWIQAVIDGREVKNNNDVKTEPVANPEPKAENKTEPKAEAPEKRDELPHKDNKGGEVPRKNRTVNPFPPRVMQPPQNVINDNDAVNNNNNNNNVNQGGLGNVNINTKGDVTININGKPINVDEPENADNADSADGTKKAESKKDLTPEEIKDARDNGTVVADKLFGYTSNTEQSVVQKIVNEELNSNNIIEFLRGYEEKLAEETKFGWDDIVSTAVTGYVIAKYNKDHFFEQMRTEWNFPEKQELLHKAANDLYQYLVNKYGVDSPVAKEVAIILLEKTFQEKQTDKLDEIVQKELG